jgi:hypothetical protein
VVGRAAVFMIRVVWVVLQQTTLIMKGHSAPGTELHDRGAFESK